MKGRAEAWLKETHGTRFELLRLFLGRFFDSDLIATPGAWAGVAGSVAAVLASLWILLGPTLVKKYATLQKLNLIDRMQQEFQSDLGALVVMCVCATLLLSALLWQSLYPTRRDCYALAAQPIRSRDLFTSKFAAVVLVFVAFVLLLTVQAAVVLYSVTAGPHLPYSTAAANIAFNFSAMAGACTFVFFSLIALQGLMLNVLPARWFDTASALVQATITGAAVATFPFSGWVAERGTHFLPTASPWILAAPVLASGVYLVSYRRYGRILLEAPQGRSSTRRDLLGWALDRWIDDPREHGAFQFLLQTLHRSRLHRLALLTYAAVAVAWVMKNAVDFVQEPPRRLDFETAMLGSAPLILLLLTLLGVRLAFSLPYELGANWAFQITEREGRLAWMKAIERFVTWLGVAPLMLLSAASIAYWRGVLFAAGWSLLTLFAAGIVGEWLFRDWRKFPFTCTYAPPQRPLVFTILFYLPLLPLMIPIGYLLMAAASNPISMLVALAIQAGVFFALRRTRQATWGLAPLRFEEQPKSEVERFGLSDEGTVLAQEEFRRSWQDYLRGEAEVPLVRPLEAGETAWARLWAWLRALPQDLCYAVRVLYRSPGFTIAAVLTLALGLGLNGAFFTTFHAFVAQPLPIRDPHSLVWIEYQTRDGRVLQLSPQEFTQLRSGVSKYVDITAGTILVADLAGAPTKGHIVSGNYFSMLGVEAYIGRAALQDDSLPVVVLSNQLWRNRFAGDPAITGKDVVLNGIPFQVIGVAPPTFTGVEGRLRVDFWAPLEAWTQLPDLPREMPLHVIGRLRPGVTMAQARSVFTSRAPYIGTGRGPEDQFLEARVEPSGVPIPAGAIRYFLPVLIAFGLTMAIPCANTANMMLARAMLRQREIGVRISLGASRGRVVRQLLAEGLLISLLAAVAGLGIAQALLSAGLRLLYATAPPSVLFLIRLPELRLDSVVFLAMAFFAVLTAVLFALAPSAQVTQVAATAAMRGELSSSLRASRLRDLLVVGQVAVCAMLLVTASLLVRGSQQTTAVNLGFDARGVFGLGFDGVATESYRAMAEALKGQPWVETLGFMSNPPTQMRNLRATLPGGARTVVANYNFVSPEYFNLLRIPIVKGRTFTEQEARADSAVVIVSENAVRRLWPGEDALGKTITIEIDSRGAKHTPFREATVVGVTRDITSRPIRAPGRAVLHFPGTLAAGRHMTPMLRGRYAPDVTRRMLESAVARTPGARHGGDVIALQEFVEEATYPLIAATWLSSLLGGIALLLTLSGMYGVLSYLVSQRTKELGIRVALGATRIRVFGFIMSYTAKLAAVGLVLGVVLATGISRYLASAGTSIDFYHPGAYLLGLGAVASAALLAALAPAKRACSADPALTLRAE